MVVFLLLTVPLSLFAYYIYCTLAETERQLFDLRQAEEDRRRQQLENFISKLANDTKR